MTTLITAAKETIRAALHHFISDAHMNGMNAKLPRVCNIAFDY